MKVFIKTFMIHERHFSEQRMEFALLGPALENLPYPHPLLPSPTSSAPT